MKTRNFKNNDFSKQFDKLTLMDIVHPKKETVYTPPAYTVNPEKDPDNLIGKMVELPPIIPARYVWHVSHRAYGCVGKTNLETFSIARRGILRYYNHYGPAVFAHNKLNTLTAFYPFFIDGAFQEGVTLNDLMIPSPWFQSCGFWRIDTHLFNGRWYIDPNMKDDPCIRFGWNKAENYICTPEDIPPYALRYFEFDMDAYISDLPRILREEDYFLQIKHLMPVEKVNDWIKRFERAA